MKIQTVAQSGGALLASLHARCFTEPWNAAEFQALLVSGNTVAQIACDGGEQPCGFVLFRIAADEAEILTIGVAPERRRAGIGRQLMLCVAATGFAQGARTLFLEVDDGNAPALSLYRQLGFEEVGRRRGYYRNCDSLADGLVLRRSLPIPAWDFAGDSTKLAWPEGS
jgi:ribosomal-protein-alanine N-acetyltransferase